MRTIPLRSRVRSVLAAALAVATVVAACSGPAAASVPPSDFGPPVSVGPSARPSVAASPSVAPSPAPSAEPVPAWRVLGPDGDAPPAREDHTLSVDPAAGVAYLFGGRDGDRAFGDLWRFDLAIDAWTRLDPAGSAPDARFGQTATWVPDVGLVVWSGQAGSRFFADIWAFDPLASAWRRLPDDGDRPPARYGSCAALGPDGRLWISHGFTEDSGRFSDTRAYDFSSTRWSDETPPKPEAPIRCLHDCLWTPDGRLLIYAGQTTGAPAIGDLWARPIDGGWTNVPDVEPEPRQLYALATIDTEPGAARAFVFGGGAADGGKLDDLWSLDLTTLAWRAEAPTGETPGARSGATLIADPARSRLVLFGGQSAERALGDVWELGLRPAG